MSKAKELFFATIVSILIAIIVLQWFEMRQLESEIRIRDYIREKETKSFNSMISELRAKNVDLIVTLENRKSCDGDADTSQARTPGATATAEE